MGKNDVLFAISSSGRSGNVVDAARIARSNQIPVISLCDFAISPLSKLSEINLYTTPRNSTQFLEMDVQLFIAQINIIDIIFFKCCTESDNERIQLLNKTKNYSDKQIIEFMLKYPGLIMRPIIIAKDTHHNEKNYQ